MVNKVAVVNAESDVTDAVKRAIESIGGFIPNGPAIIAIKPNLCSVMSAESGVTTDVRVVEGVVKYLKEKNDKLKIIIVESDSEYNANEAFKRLGYGEIEKYGVTFCNLSKDKRVKIELQKSKKISYFNLPETLLSINYFISIAKMKTHSFEHFSGVWKNQFGLIPQKSLRPRLHPFLKEVLYDINTTFYADLSIIDGINALEGPGHLTGRSKNLNCIICSKDPLSADIVASKIMGFNYKNVPHLKYAVNHGFKGSKDVLIVGDTPHFSVTEKFEFIPKSQFYLYRTSLTFGRIGRYL